MKLNFKFFNSDSGSIQAPKEIKYLQHARATRFSGKIISQLVSSSDSSSEDEYLEEMS